MRTGLGRAVELYRSRRAIKVTDQDHILDLIRELRPVTISTPLVRLGSAGDGGYLLPDDLEGISLCISPGVSVECGFDLDMANRGVDVLMADASVDGPPMEHSKFHFHKKFIDTFSDETNMTLDETVNLLPASLKDGDYLLQMDVEGAEYRILHNVSQSLLKKFRIIVVEFHFLRSIFARDWFNMVAPAFRKILRTHAVVHVHPNNCSKIFAIGKVGIPDVMEVTFYRRDRLTLTGHPITLPHPLDADNVPGRASIRMPECWKQG